MLLAGCSAIVLHPHPSMGGDSSHPFVVAVAERLRARGVEVATPDVRDPDVAKAASSLGDANLLIGYSWGSVVASHAASGDLQARVLVAPPVSMTLGSDATTPTLVLVPERDQYGDVDATKEVFADHAGATVEVIPGADHFLWGHVESIADRVVAWLEAT
jgi:alpha/beta superfamily hydrolase